MADYTTKQVADELGCSPDHVRDLIANGSLAAYKVNPTARLPRYRVTPDALQRFRNGEVPQAEVADNQRRKRDRIPRTFY